MTDFARTWAGASWVAFIASALLAFPILHLLIFLKSRQTISQYVPEHAQKQGTPTMGGLIIVAGVAAATIALGLMRSLDSHSLSFLIVFFGLAMVGFVDDFLVPRMFTGKRGLGWKQKLGLELLIAVAAAALIPEFTSAQVAICVVLVLFYSNAFNFVDGLDGMAGGVGIVMLAGLFLLNPFKGMETLFAPVIIASILPFLMLNAPPAKLFMGDIGSLPIGGAIGLMVSALLMVPMQPPGPEPIQWNLCLALALASIVMMVALIPVPLQILSVKLRKKRLFQMTPIHHAFQKNGIPETRIVCAYILGQFVCSALALTVVACTSDPTASLR